MEWLTLRRTAGSTAPRIFRKVVALNLANGNKIWENDDFQGAGSASIIDEDGTIYLCGYYGPDFFAVDCNGKTINRIMQFDSLAFGAYEIGLNEDAIDVTLYDDGNGRSVTFEVNKQDFSYSAKDEIATGYTNDQLCEMARVYYEAVTGSKAPENVVVDSENGNQISIWLYQDFGDHVATMDWYTVDRTTGRGTNTKGDIIDLTVE